MNKGNRITITIVAWFVSWFALYITFVTAGNNNPPEGFIAIISICIAGAVYYLTGKKKGKNE